MLGIYFSPGSAEGSILSVPIDVLDDSIDEYTEGFILVLDVDKSLTVADVAFTPSKRTVLVKIYDNDCNFKPRFYIVLFYSFSFIVFYFGFEQQEYTYN